MILASLIAKTTRVGLVEDHPIVLAGLRALLVRDEDLEVAFEAADGQAALEMLARTRPDVIVVDIGLPGRSGLELVGEALRASPSTAVLVFSMHVSPDAVRAALRAGAAGYVVKGSGVSEVLAAIRAVAAGQAFLSPAVASLALEDIRRAPAMKEADPFAVLSSRERQVLLLVAEGQSSKEIGARLSLSPKTVDGYRERVRGKLGLRTTADMVRFVLERRRFA